MKDDIDESPEEQTEELLDELDLLVANGQTPQGQVPDRSRAFFREHFQLPGNPFPPSGIADASSNSPPLRSTITREVIGFIGDGYRSGQTQFLVLRGEYGTGKTHILRYMEHVINTRMSGGDQAARAIYVERPRIEAQEMNRAILRSLGHDTVRKYVWFSLCFVLKRHIAEDAPQLQAVKESLSALAAGGRKKAASPTPSLFEGGGAQLPGLKEAFDLETIADYRTFLSCLERHGWSREDIRPYLNQLLTQALDEQAPQDLVQAFVALLLAPDEAKFTSWETLLSITNVKAVSSLQAPAFLQVLLRVMRHNGIVHVYLLLDEFEEVSQGAFLSMRQRQNYLYTMREVLDRIQHGLSIVIAIIPGGWDALIAEAVPLGDRNNRRVELDRLEAADAVKMAQSYLDRERARSNNAGQTNFPMGSLHPLSPELIGFVLDEFPRGVQRTPRNVIQFLYRLLDYATKNQIRALDQDVAALVLREFGAMKSVRSAAPRGRRAATHDDGSGS